MFINTSRGGLVSSEALIKGLSTGQIGWAGLDVLEEEAAYVFEDRSCDTAPPSAIMQLMTFPGVIVTGHQAFFTKEAMTTIAGTTIDNALLYLKEGRKQKNHPNFVAEGC